MRKLSSGKCSGIKGHLSLKRAGGLELGWRLKTTQTLEAMGEVAYSRGKTDEAFTAFLKYLVKNHYRKWLYLMLLKKQ